jgi:crossover junction endodeoxyribonuclease RuvC
MNNPNAWIGIDPGQTGALALIDSDDGVIVHDWPGDERTLIDLCRTIHLSHRIRSVWIEQQQAMPGQGVSSTFKLGVNFGMWLSACAAFDWPVHTVRPSAWKLGLGYPAGDYNKSKKHSLTLARRLFPQAADRLKRVKDNGRAEALLLAHLAKGGKV